VPKETSLWGNDVFLAAFGVSQGDAAGSHGFDGGDTEVFDCLWMLNLIDAVAGGVPEKLGLTIELL